MRPLLLLAFCLALTACARKPQLSSGDVLFLGDSITAGYGLDKAQAFPSLIEITGMTMINLGVSGSQSDTAVPRLNDYLAANQPPQLVVLELGANDFLHGVPHETTAQNLTAAVRLCQSRHIPILVLGLHIPGQINTTATFRRVANDTGAALLPDIFDGMDNDDSLYQDDGHPSAKGQQRIAEKVQAALLKNFVFSK